MNLAEYQKRCGDTDKLMELSPETRNDLYIAGLRSEVDEVSDATKRSPAKARTAVNEELGDAMWYLARLASNHDLTLDEIIGFNLTKLKARYG